MIDSTAALVWHTFLELSPIGLRTSLYQSLSPEILIFLKNTPQLKLPLPKRADLPEDQIDHIHASWFAPFLRTLAENDIHFFLSCLKPDQIKTLQKTLLSN